MSERTRKFAWIPTSVHSSKYFRDGFRWLKYIWLDTDGRYYTRKI